MSRPLDPADPLATTPEAVSAHGAGAAALEAGPGFGPGVASGYGPAYGSGAVPESVPAYGSGAVPESVPAHGSGAASAGATGYGPGAGRASVAGSGDAGGGRVDRGVNGRVNTAARRRPAVDPVKVLMHRHRALCEQAVDPLEIAVGLEAHGVTDRTAARFRHRDVFSLAEELYARVPRTDPAPPPQPQLPPGRRREDVLALGYALLTGALAVTAALLPGGGPAGTAARAAAVLAALLFCLRRGPLRAAGTGRTPFPTRAAAALLLGYAWYTGAATSTALALGLAPAVCCAALFAAGARRRLAASRALDEFAAGARPLFLTVIALHTAALAGLLVLTGGDPLTGIALGSLLFAARLLAVHGLPAGAALGAACAAEAAAWAAGLPGGGLAAAALALLVHACAVLSRASAHSRA
ncbi:hypothetical protein [Streptomyces sp. NBC_00239]|uniref:hypothetical protein n=1 Tax=Streptomyces sp. NBC_00239 TaxID=2903640 RepID=UPI002E2BE9B6|nr:hypothetical protein [Streptomyces sp. NBC_00239]